MPRRDTRPHPMSGARPAVILIGLSALAVVAVAVWAL